MSANLDLGRAGVGDAAPEAVSRPTGDLLVRRLEAIELGLGELLEIEEGIVRAVDRTDQLVELELDRGAVSVLRVLDEEDHEERNDRRRRVDDELPGRAEMEDRSGDKPADDERSRSDEGDGVTGRAGGPLREPIEERAAVHLERS